VFHQTDSEYFHRTLILNLMTKLSKTKIVCNYDTDVVFPEQQYINSVNKIKKGDTLVFPYGGKFMNVPKTFFQSITDNKFEDLNENDLELAHPNSLGGAFFFDKEKYNLAGLENENFISWGFEDNERINRLSKLGYIVSRSPGLLYHLDHERTVNSSPNHKYYGQNIDEFNKINNLSKSDLEDYIKTWHWIN